MTGAAVTALIKSCHDKIFIFLSSAGGWHRWFFITLASVVSLVLLVWLMHGTI